MLRFFLIIIFSLAITEITASEKNAIKKNLKEIDNFSFNFEQNINGKIEKGNCTIQYPKKIYCEYDSSNKKILVSNGKSLVIKSKTSYYLYPLKSTPLNLILDKDFLLQKISIMEEKLIDEEFINYKFVEDNNEINIFFSRKNYNLIGWQTIDIYQNLNNTYLSSITKNQKLKKNLFKLPAQN
jgi:outer membrane lipoprotein-sorting protein